jgi:hypothetical protein
LKEKIMLKTSIEIKTIGKDGETLTEQAWEEDFDSLEALKLRLFNLTLKGFIVKAFKKVNETSDFLVKKETFLERFISKGSLVEQRIDFFPEFNERQVFASRKLA